MKGQDKVKYVGKRERGVDLLFLSLRLEDPDPIQIERDVWLHISSILLFHPSKEGGAYIRFPTPITCHQVFGS